jgi:hypothetical protein
VFCAQKSHVSQRLIFSNKNARSLADKLVLPLYLMPTQVFFHFLLSFTCHIGFLLAIGKKHDMKRHPQKKEVSHE